MNKKNKIVEKVRLNMGSASKRIDGYLNVDVRKVPDVDIILDLTAIPYEENFAVADTWLLEDVPKDDWTDWVDEILAQEFLEHISFKVVSNVLAEWNRIMKPGGILNVQVPDIGKMCEYYTKKQICQCVPHKARDWNSFSAMRKCSFCNGKAKVNPDRWRFAFSGAGKHDYDWHKNQFTEESLKSVLKGAGFRDIKFDENIYKLVCRCKK